MVAIIELIAAGIAASFVALFELIVGAVELVFDIAEAIRGKLNSLISGMKKGLRQVDTPEKPVD